MINNVVLIGRLVADAELRTTTTGKEVATFRIAVDRSYAKQGEEKQADFITIVAWGHTALFVSRYFSKGSMIAVQGSIQTRSYEDKDGNKRTAFEVVAREVSFCGSKSENSSTDKSTDKSTGTTTYQPPADIDVISVEDDLPF
jgi:single-strand DNA-binding protein